MRKLLIITSLFVSLAMQAQAPKDKWGTATAEELQMNSCPFDPGANAAILGNYGHYYFNRHFYFSAHELRTFYHYQVRLKIYNEEGIKYATVSIPYRGKDEYEDVIEISGNTYNLDANGKVVKTKFRAKNAVYKRNDNGIWNCTFTLPNVKAGSVIEYSYKIASLDFVELRDWLFQTDIPVMQSSITLSTPNFYQFAFFSNINHARLNIKRDEQPQYLQFYNTNVYCHGSRLELSLNNIPAFRKEVWMPDSSQQILKGEFLLASALTRPFEFSRFRDYYLMPYFKPLLLTTTTNYYEPEPRISLYNEMLAGYKIIEGMDWESFVKKLNKRDDFGKNLLKVIDNKWLTDSFRRIGDKKQRLIAIYDYVKQNIRWNGVYRIFSSSSLEKVFEKKTGYSSDINMLLINLLNRSGIQARPVLISTRSYGSVYKEAGFFRKFNHVIASAELEETKLLLDATDPLMPYDFLSTEDLNGEGLLINLQNYEWVPLTNHSVSKIQTKEIYPDVNSGSYTIDVTTTLTGYPAVLKSRETPESQLHEYTVAENNDSPLVIKSSLKSPNEANDSIIIAPLANNSLTENPFNSTNRTYPVDLGFEKSITREIEIPIPAGYKLISYPKNRDLIMEGEFMYCSVKSDVEENRIKIQYTYDINNAYIPAVFYPDLKLFMETIKLMEQEKVVFRKSN